jgi:hypothetical protein
VTKVCESQGEGKLMVLLLGSVQGEVQTWTRSIPDRKHFGLLLKQANSEDPEVTRVSYEILGICMWKTKPSIDNYGS